MIMLTDVAAAIFVAESEFGIHSKLKFPQRMEYNLIWAQGHDHMFIKSKKIKKNFKTREDWLVAMRKYQLEKLRYMYKYLLDHYPSKDYAQVFLTGGVYDDYWIKELQITQEEIICYNGEKEE